MPPSVDGAVRAVRDLKKQWRPRNDHFEKWYRLREMRDDNAQAGYVSAVLNDARTLFDISLFFLSHKPPVVRVPVLGKVDAEQVRAGTSEVALTAIQRMIDRDRNLSGLQTWQRDMSDFLLSTGWWSDTNLVLKNTDGTPLFVADVNDPAEVYPEFGYRRTSRIVHSYPASLGLIRSKARALNWTGDYSGDSAQDVNVHVIYEYDDDGAVWNTVLVEAARYRARRDGMPSGFEVAIAPMKTDLFEIPLRTGSASGWAVRRSRPGSKDEHLKRYGESILEPGRPIYDAKNLWATLVMQKAHDASQPTMLARGRGGRFTVSEEDMLAGTIIPVDLDEGLERVDKGDLPQSIQSIVLPMLERGEQRAGISDLFFGNVSGLDLAGAGFAISLLEPNALSRLAPYADALEFIGSTRDSYFLEALRNGKFKPIKLAGRGTQDISSARQVYYKEFDSKDIPEHSYVDWEVTLATPSQLLQALSIARQAIPQGDLLDLDTVLEKVLKVEDPARVKEEIKLAESARNPLVQQVETIVNLETYASELRKQAKGYQNAGDSDSANVYRKAASRVEDIITQTVEGAARTATAGGGLPASLGALGAAPGARPEAAGTQTGGALNGDLAAAGAPAGGQ